MTADKSKFHLDYEAVKKLLPTADGAEGEDFTYPFVRGQLKAGLFAPRGSDTQTPHARDEIYIVMAGSGEFVCEESRVNFHPGDFLFVPAGAEHCFENFTDNFYTWVIFTGPEGGEKITE